MRMSGTEMALAWQGDDSLVTPRVPVVGQRWYRYTRTLSTSSSLRTRART